MSLHHVEKRLENSALTIFGAFHPTAEHKVAEGIGTLVMLGPKEPGFWATFTQSSEYQDGAADPLDRWSERVVGVLAKDLNAQAFFPFGGPPFQPFIRWAHASGRAHQSPVGLLVHDQAGLMLSYRGALGFSEQFELPENPASPCLSCENKPCLTACPVDAFGQGFYDVPTCKTYLNSGENDCMSKGCAVRRVCPVTQSYGRQEAQSAFHMRAFK